MKYIFFLFLFLSSISVGFSEEPTLITDINIAKKAAFETKTDLVLVFTADWCKYCPAIKNAITNDKDILGNYTVCYVDFDSNKKLAQKYNVSALPYSVLVDDKDNRIKSYKGYGSINTYRKWLGL